MSSQLIGGLIDASVETITRHAGELTELDSAIGDGDHGLNMQRGFAAVADAREELASLPLHEALSKTGMILVMKVGGASGPLYGSALMAMGKSGATGADLLRCGVQAVKSRGRSDAGEKTMLDVLVPVLAAMDDRADITSLRRVADQALLATRDMLATRGRASFLGERSVGHLDPGARSSCLLLHAVCDVLEGSR